MKTLTAATIAVLTVFAGMIGGILSASPLLVIVSLCASWPVLAVWGFIAARSGVRIVIGTAAPAPVRPAAPQPIQRRASRIDEMAG